MEPQLNEESQKVIKYLLKSSPYGQELQVLKDIEKLVPVNTDDEMFVGGLREHNEEHMALCPINPPKEYLLLMECNKHNNGYIDQSRQSFYVVDHKNQKILQAQNTDTGLPEHVLQFVGQLRKALDDYVAKYYRDPSGAQVFADMNEVDGNGNPTVWLGYTSKNINLPNCYTGEWLGKWKLHGESFHGTITVNSHYFESGNVQWHQTKNYELTVGSERSSSTIGQIIKILERAETDLQGSINELYEDEMPNYFMKSLRRVQPVTKAKMVWNMSLLDMRRNLETANKIEKS